MPRRRRKTRGRGQRKNKRRRGTRRKRNKRGGFWKKKCFIQSQCDKGQICLHDGLPHFATYGIGSGVCVAGPVSTSSGAIGKNKSSSCIIL